MSASGEDKETNGELIAAFILGLAEWPLDAWVFTRLWLWFATPLGAPRIGGFHALGLMVLVRFVTSTRWNPKKTEHYLKQATGHLVYALIALLIGWVFKSSGGAP